MCSPISSVMSCSGRFSNEDVLDVLTERSDSGSGEDLLEITLNDSA